MKSHFVIKFLNCFDASLIKASERTQSPTYKTKIKMSEAKKIRLSVNLDMLPPELLEKIFKFLHIKDICQTQKICRKWKEITVKGNLVKKASGNFLNYVVSAIFSDGSNTILSNIELSRTSFFEHRTNSNIIFRTSNELEHVHQLVIEL